MGKVNRVFDSFSSEKSLSKEVGALIWLGRTVKLKSKLVIFLYDKLIGTIIMIKKKHQDK
jgi:flagellar hook assembly protein FlgD